SPAPSTSLTRLEPFSATIMPAAPDGRFSSTPAYGVTCRNLPGIFSLVGSYAPPAVLPPDCPPRGSPVKENPARGTAGTNAAGPVGEPGAASAGHQLSANLSPPDGPATNHITG